MTTTTHDFASHVMHHDGHNPTHSSQPSPAHISSMSGHDSLLHAGYLESFLFPGTETTSQTSFVAACFATMAAAFLMEIVKFVLRNYQEKKTHIRLVTCDICHHTPGYLTFPTYNLNSMRSSSDDSRIQSESNLVTVSKADSFVGKIFPWAVLSFGQFSVTLAGLMLMLLAMSMNIYVLFSLAFGTTIGHMAVVWHQQKNSEAK